MKNLNIAASVWTPFIFSLSLSVLAVFIGCSSKKDEISANKAEPCAPRQVDTHPAAAVPDSDAVQIAAPTPADNNEPNSQAAGKTSGSKKSGSLFAEPSIDTVITDLSRPGTPTEKKIEILESLSMLASLEDPNVIDVVRVALEDPNAAVGQSAIELLDGYEDPAILPAVQQALANNDQEIRRAAIQLLENIDDPQVGDTLAQSLNDPSEDVRAAVFDAAEEQDNAEVLLRLAGNGLRSPYEDVQDRSVSLLEDRGDKTAVVKLIDGLQTNNPNLTEKINDALEFIVDQKFDSYEQGQKWWEANKNKYDAEMSPLD
jgi:hypothetical protein